VANDVKSFEASEAHVNITTGRRRWPIPVILVVAALALGAGVRSSFFGRIGPQPDGTGITPNHWTLTPAGLQVEVGDRPLGLAATPDGRHLVISNNGQGVQSLVLFDTATQRVVQVIPYASPEALFLGVAVTPDGRRVYASAGGNNKIRAYEFDGRALRARAPIVLGDRKARIFPAGLAVSPDGGTLYAALNLDNAVAFIDTAARRVRLTVRLAPPARPDDIGTLPYALLLVGRKLYVSEWNGGGVSVIDTDRGTLLRRIPTGGHASGLALSPDRGRLYVANATSDTVSAIDPATDTVIGTVDLTPYPGAPMGSMPNAVAVSPDGKTLYVANGGNNDVAVVETATLAIRGLIPTAWFPSALAVSPDGRLLYVANMKGLGAGPNPRGPNPERRVPGEQFIASMARGTLSVIDVPDAETLSRYTAQVVKNNGFDETHQVLTRTPQATTPHAVPRRVGDPSLIRHVLYVIKENRTYDQILGDLAQGDGDPGLVLFGRDVTPNHHALAETFTLFDHCYADAEVSADGHNWSTAAVATDYVQKTWPANYSGRNRSYDFEGGSSAPAPLGGYLWEYAARAGVSYRVYGEFNAFTARPPAITPAPFAKALDGHLSPTYPGYDLTITDQARVDAWKAEFDDFIRTGKVPALMILRLPNDHTAGTRPGLPTPKAMVADNDLALGRIVEAVSRSPIWPATAIFVIEDDAQNGPDHVDAHRTVCLVASPYARRGYVDHTMYSTVSMLRSLELILGLPPMSQFDAAATPMFAAFTDAPTLAPYQALTPTQPLGERNGPDAYRAEDSLRLALERADEADEAAFNAILWHAIKGPDVPMPPARTAFRPHPLQDDD
jgi:YVTN family beta-propeller protein